MEQPRPEYPRPEFARESWLNLNGEWGFAFDSGDSGEAQGWHADPSPLSPSINVPFCPESEPSGLGQRDFIEVLAPHPLPRSARMGRRARWFTREASR